MNLARAMAARGGIFLASKDCWPRPLNLPAATRHALHLPRRRNRHGPGHAGRRREPAHADGLGRLYRHRRLHQRHAVPVAAFNVAAQQADPSSQPAFYKAMLAPRRDHPSIAGGSYENVVVSGTAMRFQRLLGSERARVASTTAAAGVRRKTPPKGGVHGARGDQRRRRATAAPASATPTSARLIGSGTPVCGGAGSSMKNSSMPKQSTLLVT